MATILLLLICGLHEQSCVTIHYITPDFILRSHLLETKEFSDSHSAENVAEELRSILNHWELSTDKVVAVTTDNCANMVRAIRGVPIWVFW